jgi:anthranilate synthase
MPPPIQASALLDALTPPQAAEATTPLATPPLKRRVLLVDHEDSFVHTLANYLRQTGSEVITVRSGPNAAKALARSDWR